jgi:hypothetical protein
MAFHRYAWNMVGYMDARFGKYGHEHTEFTNRFLRNGFGGIRRETSGQMEHYYYVIGGGISLLYAAPHGTPAEMRLALRGYDIAIPAQSEAFQ